MSTAKPKVVLAFSGGLDTSYCVKYLAETRGLEVHTITVDTGGFSAAELQDIEARALALGAASHRTEMAAADFYQHCLRYLIYGNVLRYQTYPLSVSAERVFQAVAVARHALRLDAPYVAHGSTGAGNDQVRFDLAFRILIPSAQIITPIRELQLSRQDEIDFLKQKGVQGNWEKSLYSVNQGLWGTTVGGKETLTSHGSLPEEAWPTHATATQPQAVTLHYTSGQLTGIDGQTGLNPLDAIQRLAALAAPYAIGRDVHVGDTIIGIKGRVAFEAGVALLVVKSHHLLEKHTLTKWQLHWKQQLADWYGMLLHEGQFLDPVMRNIETFLESTQHTVTGTVNLRLHPHRFELLGCTSPNDLMSSSFGQYGEMNRAWSGQDVQGFTTVAAIPSQLFYHVNQLPDFLKP